MNALDLVRLAAILSQHGPGIIRLTREIPSEFIDRYWDVSQRRHAAWTRILGGDGERSDDISDDGTGPVLNCVEEILLSEPLLRLWSSVVCAVDHHTGRHQDELVIRAVYLGHQVVYQKLLNWLLRNSTPKCREVERLNALRHTVESWSDLMIANVAAQFPEFAVSICSYACNCRKTVDLSREIRKKQRRYGQRHFESLLLTTMHASVSAQCFSPAVNPVLNREIASSILSSLDAAVFDRDGIFLSEWVSRMLYVARETDLLINDELFRQPNEKEQ